MIKIHNVQEYNDFWKLVEKETNDLKWKDPWNVWFEWDLSVEDADNPQVRKIFGANVCILDKFKKLYRNVVVDVNCPTRVGRLTSVQVTNEDFYWVIETPPKVSYVTCCSDIRPV